MELKIYKYQRRVSKVRRSSFVVKLVLGLVLASSCRFVRVGAKRVLHRVWKVPKPRLKRQLIKFEASA